MFGSLERSGDDGAIEEVDSIPVREKIFNNIEDRFNRRDHLGALPIAGMGNSSAARDRSSASQALRYWNVQV
jgi:hypothetical protein